MHVPQRTSTCSSCVTRLQRSWGPGTVMVPSGAPVQQLLLSVFATPALKVPYCQHDVESSQQRSMS
jgi:hypothetical protein